MMIVNHKDNLFTNITTNINNPLTYLVEVYKTPDTGIQVMLDTTLAYYFLVKDKKVIYPKLYDLATAKRIADTFNLQQWLDMQSAKGFTKKQLLADISNNQIKACKSFTLMKGQQADTEFYPVLKVKGRGCIDIIRNGKPSVLFYPATQPANLIRYTGDELVLYLGGYRMCNQAELDCQLQWERLRDKQVERLDAMTDGSGEYHRKKKFFRKHGCEHLLTQRYKGLVQDNSIRECPLLIYKLQHSTK